MLFEVKKGIVKLEGVFHRKGSFFDANSYEVRDLLEQGVISKTADIPEEVPLVNNTDPDFVLPTVEEFSKMKPDEQKALLTEVGIDPASKAEDRLKQYAEFYESVDIDDADL